MPTYTNETHNLADIDPDLHSKVDHSRVVPLADKELRDIVRLRLLTSPGCPVWDVSYCYGRMRDGSLVRVELPRYQLPRQGFNGALINMFKDEGRFGKLMKLWEPGVLSKLW